MENGVCQSSNTHTQTHTFLFTLFHSFDILFIYCLLFAIVVFRPQLSLSGQNGQLMLFL